MKVLILGSGVIGVASAWYLAEAGHEVEVVDRQPGPALETSYANAGEVSPGYSSPWAGPGVPAKVVKWLTMPFGPLVIRPTLDPAMAIFLLRLLRNCTSARYAQNKARMVPIAEYSRDRLRDLRAATGIAYDERSKGTLQLFRTEKQVRGTAEDIAVLKQFGVPYELLDVDGCIGAEPALRLVREKIVGGLRLPDDETGDCKIFTERLAKLAEARGVRFRFSTTIESVLSEGGKVTGIATGAGPLKADAYIVALGSYSPRMLRPLGISVPVYPVKGYSITVPVKDPDGAPVSTIMDESYKIAITRLGDRIRVGGTAEVSGFDLTPRPARRATLEHSVGDLFPRGGDLAAGTFWCGLRPMTPDGPPLICGTSLPNLYLNTGHGTLGWTMACGSGQVIADIVSGKRPEIDISGLDLGRYGP
jgi:D-amino-acid dehydrogenase